MHLSNNPLPGNAYQSLIARAGLPPKTDAEAEMAVSNTLHFTCIISRDDEYIGLGRLVGDGATFCEIVDVCVVPEWQGTGIERIIMQDLVDYINDMLPQTCYIGLLSDCRMDKLFRAFGFEDMIPKPKELFYKQWDAAAHNT